MPAVAGFNSSIFISTNLASVSMTNEGMTDSGDHTTYTVTATTHRYWDNTTAPVVQLSTDGGSTWNTQAASTYTVQYVGGKVIWNSAKSAGNLTRLLSGKYFAFTTFALGKDWELQGTQDMTDVTVFGASRAKQFLPTLFTGTFAMKAFWIDNTFLNNLQTGFNLVFSGQTPSGNRYEAYAFTKTDKIHAMLTGAVEEDLSFDVTGAWYYN